MTRLIVSADAESDTSRIIGDLLREAGPFVANDYGRRFQKALERVIHAPESGTPRRALGPDTRMLIVYPYLLIYDYTPEEDTVTLLRIVHGRRNITRRFLRR